MATTREIKRRIRGITSTKQITNAMELVSTAKLRKARERLDNTKPYYVTVAEDVARLLKLVKSNHKFLVKRDIKNVLNIVVTGDRGLAGGYNANIIKLAEESAVKNGACNKFLTIGTKGRDYFNRKGYDVIKSISGVSEEFSFDDALEVGSYALELYINGEVDKINLFYTTFESMISCKPTKLTLLPFSMDFVDSDENVNIGVVTFEPSPEEVLDFLIPKYLEIVIYGAMIEAATSEQSSRRVAMENATDNANNMIDELSIVYNRARQAAITSEISEIVSGAEALK